MNKIAEVNNSPKVQGTLGVAGGVITKVTGTAILLAPEPTGVTKVEGTYGVVQDYAGRSLGLSLIADAQDKQSTRKIKRGLISQMATVVDPNNENRALVGAMFTELALGFGVGKIGTKLPGLIVIPQAIKNTGDVLDINSAAQAVKKDIQRSVNNQN